MTGFIGICLLLMMTVLAGIANDSQAVLFRNILNVAAILGALWMLWPKRHLTILSIENKPSWIQKPQHFFRNTAIILGGQCVFLAVSLLFLGFIEIQTQSNYRLFALPEGHLLNFIKKDAYSFFLLPWIVYAVIGIGLGYFCLVKDRIPNLFNALIPPNPKQPLLFFHNYFSTVVFMTLIIPFLIIMVMIVLFFADGLNGLTGFESFYVSPIRSLFLSLFVGIILNKVNGRHLPAMVEKRNTLGRILVTYAGFAALLLYWISWMSYVAFSNISEEAVIASSQAAAKSLLLQKFNQAEQDTRISILLWSWWIIWLPIMGSFIARFTIGKNLTLAFISAIIFPITVFFVLKNSDSSSYMDLTALWHVISAGLKDPFVQVIVAFTLAGLLWLTLRRMYSIADLLRGFMQDFGRMRRFPLTSWVSSTLYCMVAYLTSIFLVGWLGLQILMAIGAWFMTTLVLTFVVALYFETNWVKNIVRTSLKAGSPPTRG